MSTPLPAPTQNPALERALRVLFPPRCAACGLWCDDLFCGSCAEKLKAIEAPLCQLCGEPFDALAQVLESSRCAACNARFPNSRKPPLHAMRAPLEYSGSIREAIHAFKYSGKTFRAPELAALLREYLLAAEEGRALRVENLRLIVPIPLHGFRAWRRGFNQSTLLARELAIQLQAENYRIEVAEVLRRVRHTTPQVELRGRERESNIKDAFALDENLWREYSARIKEDDAVLILDDVTTTGSTLFECARVLTKSTNLKPEQIFALTLARAV